LIFDLSRRASIALDYQETLPDKNTTLLGGINQPLKSYFMHVVANF
jgi:hypothetical protein